MSILKLVMSPRRFLPLLMFAALGCGSSAPRTLDAEGEAALRAEMSKVESVEQQHFKSQPPPKEAANVNEGEVNRMNEGSNVGERAF
jgi:hypothetical protein